MNAMLGVEWPDPLQGIPATMQPAAVVWIPAEAASSVSAGQLLGMKAQRKVEEKLKRSHGPNQAPAVTSEMQSDGLFISR